MSTKTLRKRIALVAVSAMGFGLMSTVVAPSASAAAVTATVSPVRVTYSTATTPDLVPYAKISWTSSLALAASDSMLVTLLNAPTAAAVVDISDNSQIGVTTLANIVAGTPSTVGNANLQYPSVITLAGATQAAGTVSFAIAATIAGTYSGTIKTQNAATPQLTDTVSFSFTTTGAITSMTTAVSDASTVSGGTSSFTVTVKDAAGNTTQPLGGVDSVAITTSAGTLSAASMVSTDSTTTGLFDGVGVVVLTTSGTAAAVHTLTATPRGTLGSIAAQTATVTNASGTIDATPVTAISYASGATAGGTPITAVTQQARPGTSSITVGIVGTAMATTYGAVAPIHRFLVAVSAGTANGVASGTATYVNISTDEDGVGSTTITLAGAATYTGATLTLTQVSGSNAVVSSGGVITIIQTAVALTHAKFTSSLGGSLVRILGASTSTDVTVKDQFGTAVGSGYTVTAYRGSVAAANVVSTGTTNASGVATVTVSPLSTVVTGGAETYVFTAQGAGAAESSATALSTNTIVITYTTTGNITSMSTAISGITGATTPVTDTTVTAERLKYPVVTIPGNDGVANVAVGTEYYTVSTGTVTAGTAAELVTLTTTNTPGNSTVWTSDAGAFVSSSATIAASAALTTVTVNNGASVYVYAHTPGLHAITATSGGKTSTVYVWAQTSPSNYYTMSASALSSSLVAGANTVMTMTLNDMYGNVVDAANGLVTATASGSVRLAGGALTQDLNTTVAGISSFTVIADAVAGTGTITLAPATTGAAAWASTFTALTGMSAPVSTVTLTFTVTASTVKTVDQVSTELAAVSAALTAKIAADAAAATAAATKAAADKLVLDAAIAAVLDAANSATDAATEAIDNGSAATAAAQDAIDAGDAATAAAQDAADAAAEATAAAEAAGEIAQTAADTATEAVDAANAATDAANAAAEAADAATNAALDAVDAANAASDAVAALATQMATAISALKAQITALTNLVVKIQKKVKA